MFFVLLPKLFTSFTFFVTSNTRICSFIKEKNFFPSGGAVTLLSFHQCSPKLFPFEMLNNDNESVGVNI